MHADERTDCDRPAGCHQLQRRRPSRQPAERERRECEPARRRRCVRRHQQPLAPRDCALLRGPDRLPNYVGTFRGAGGSGFGDVAPAFKWQISPVPGKVDVSMTIGAGLPTGAGAIAGRGVQPYLQFPWSVELRDGWSVTGMVTNFFTPDNPVNKFSNQSTVVLEREFGERSFLFVEYVGDFPINGGTGQLINSGGGHLITDTQQIDFHNGFGLNRNSPT